MNWHRFMMGIQVPAFYPTMYPYTLHNFPQQWFTIYQKLAESPSIPHLVITGKLDSGKLLETFLANL